MWVDYYRTQLVGGGNMSMRQWGKTNTTIDAIFGDCSVCGMAASQHTDYGGHVLRPPNLIATKPVTSCCFVAFDEFMPDRCSRCKDTAVADD